MQRYPIGIQDFESLREDGYVYIDKTEQIYKLLDGKYYFLSRPRRFGKSLLINTLDAIFSGKKHLFEGLWIEDKIEWKTYPIIRLSFAIMDYKNLGLEHQIIASLQKNAQKYKLNIDLNSPKAAFIDLIEKLSQIDKVVILIDEYDKPLIDYLEPDQIPTAQKHRDILKNFYGTLKDSDKYIRFVFITGVSKFSKVSIFSDLNHLEDLTINPLSATLVGYTQSELEKYFGQEIKQMAEKEGLSYAEMLEKIRLWYNGYSWQGEKVYNPFSILRFVKSADFMNFWFETGSPNFLIQILNRDFDYNFEDIEADDRILGSFQLENLNPITLLFQTGYLTIKEKIGRDYVLTYPNKEVKYSLLENLLGDYTQLPNLSATAKRVHKAFETQNWEMLKEQINILFSKIPNQIFDAHQEKYYHAIIFMIFQLLDYQIQAEVSTSKGRIDVVVSTTKNIFIVEFKLNESAEKAILQIREKEYYKPYLEKERNIILVGISLENKEVQGILVENLENSK